MSEQLRQRIVASLDAMAADQGVSSELTPDYRRVEPRTYGRVVSVPAPRDEWRTTTSRPASRLPKREVPAEARDLEGRYADAPDAFNVRTGVGPQTVRIVIISVQWDKVLGTTDQYLSVTGRDVRTKNSVFTKLAEISNIGDDA